LPNRYPVGTLGFMIPTNMQVSAVSGGGLEPPTVHAQKHIIAGQRLGLNLCDGLSSLSVYPNRTLRVQPEGLRDTELAEVDAIIESWVADCQEQAS